MKKLLLTLTAAIAAVATCFGLSACKDSDDDKGVPAESITLSVSTATLDVNGTQALTYTVVPEDANVKVEISDNTVVKYENDTLTAITAGVATVKVYSVADTSVYAECAVTVSVPDGFNAHKADKYKFIYPEDWTKTTISGADVVYQSAGGSSVNALTASKNDLSWSLTESTYKSVMRTQYQSMGYTVESMTVSITDDTYLGNKRRCVVSDISLSYIGVVLELHQEQVLLQSSSNTYILTIAYSGSYSAQDMSLMISQFAVYD